MPRAKVSGEQAANEEDPNRTPEIGGRPRLDSNV